MAAEKRFEHYEVLERKDGSLWELGRGAMGVTYKAFDTDLHCTVALKVINPAILNTEGTEQRFLREARAAAQLRHPNIATVLRLGKTGDATHFYAMEFCEGDTLEQLVTKQGPLNIELALDFTLQVAKALAVAEEHHVVHRDIKPSNLIVVSQRAEGFVVKVIDFGLAKAVTGSANSWTSMSLATAGFIGTAHFSSPEQLEEGQVDVRSDIYSLGATLWFMLTGQPMFSGSVARVMSQHLASPPPWEQLDSLSLPEAMRRLLTSMLAKNPKDRPQSALDLKQFIQSCLEEVRHKMPTSPAIPKSSAGAAGVLNNRWKLLEECHGLRRGLYRAVDLKDQGRLVGVRMLDPLITQNAAEWQRLEHTVDLFQRSPHGLVRPIKVDRDETERPFLVTEWVNGIPLVILLRRRGSLSWKETLKLLSDLAGAFDFAVEYQLECGPFRKEEVLLAFPEQFVIESHFDEITQKSLVEWADARAVIDLLPINAADFSPNQTVLSMATVLPGAASVSEVGVVPSLQEVGLFVYELLGGTARSGNQRYVPIARVSSEGNDMLKAILTAPEGGQKALTAEQFAAQLAATTSFDVAIKPATVESPPAPRVAAPLPAPVRPEIAVPNRTPIKAPVADDEAKPAETAQRITGSAKKKLSVYAISAAAAVAIIAAGGLLWWTLSRHSNVAPRPNANSSPANIPVALNGNLLSTQYSPKGDIRVEHRSGGFVYLISQGDQAKHYLLHKSSENTANVLFSPDENWLILNERAQLNDSSSQLFHRVRSNDIEYAEANDMKPSGQSLTESGWRFYLQEIGLAETTARDEVRLSGVEWKPDSSTVRLRFDNFGPKGQKLVPQPYVCAYDVNGKRFSSESDADAIRSILNAPVAQANEVPINSTLPAASEIPWQKHVGDFVTAFVRTNQSTDTEATVGYYAANVDYFDQGRVDQSFIHTDVEKYNGRWPTRHDEVENNYISFQETRPGSDYLASFNLIFFAASPARRECVRGKLAVTMHVTLTGDPKITAMQQKTLQREKGTLQITNTGFTPVWHPSKQQARGSSPNTRQSPSGNNNQMDPAAAGILGGILDGLSRGGHPPLIKPRKRP